MVGRAGRSPFPGSPPSRQLLGNPWGNVAHTRRRGPADGTGSTHQAGGRPCRQPLCLSGRAVPASVCSSAQASPGSGDSGSKHPSEPPCWLLPSNIRRHREGQMWERPWNPAPQSGNSALTGWQGEERLVEMPPSPHFPSDLNASRWSPSWVLVGQGLVGWPQVWQLPAWPRGWAGGRVGRARALWSGRHGGLWSWHQLLP